MLRNYFIITLRAFQKQKSYAIINILGLSVGIACAIFIFLYIHSELTYDKNFPKSDDTHILGFNFIDNEGIFLLILTCLGDGVQLFKKD